MNWSHRLTRFKVWIILNQTWWLNKSSRIGAARNNKDRIAISLHFLDWSVRLDASTAHCKPACKWWIDKQVSVITLLSQVQSSSNLLCVEDSFLKFSLSWHETLSYALLLTPLFMWRHYQLCQKGCCAHSEFGRSYSFSSFSPSIHRNCKHADNTDNIDLPTHGTLNGTVWIGTAGTCEFLLGTILSKRIPVMAVSTSYKLIQSPTTIWSTKLLSCSGLKENNHWLGIFLMRW